VPQLPADDRRAIWNQAAVDSVAPLSGWGALLYLVFAVSHLVILPRSEYRVLTPLALTTALTMGLTHLISRRRRPAARHAHAWLFFLICLATINSTTHLAIQRDPMQSTNIALVFFGSGVLVLSRSVYATIVVLGTAAFVSVALTSGEPDKTWMHMAFALLSAAVAGLVAVISRQRNTLRLAQSERELRENQAKLRLAFDGARLELERRERVERELRELGQELEIRVDARTRALAQSHALLRIEVDERRAAQEELLDKRTRLARAERLETVGLLAGGVAHDFNNVLTVILACAELSARRSPETQKLMEEIEKAAGQASQLTRQLLAFGRKQVLDPKPTNLNDVIRGTEPLLSRMLGGHVKLVTRLDPDLCRTKVDVGQIEQVLANLAINARDAMPEGGTLTLSTQNVVLGEAEVVGLDAGRYAECSVTDTGVGMDEAVCARIFEPFFTTKGGRGTGLGLSSVHGIIKQSAGEISVESAPSRGTTFRFWLPAYTGEARPERPRADRPVEATTHCRVLLVEDNHAVRELLEQWLLTAGFEVLAAENGKAALDRLASDDAHVDVVVTDVLMPVMNGHELVTRLAAIDPAIRVLFISAYAPEELLSLPLAQPAAVLQKPFAPSLLVRRVRELLTDPTPLPPPPSQPMDTGSR
jgi:signal transduction histidine kinase